MKYPITFQEYYPEAVTYGDHKLSWTHTVAANSDTLYLICEVCQSSSKFPVSLTGSGKLIIKEKNEFIVNFENQTIASFKTQYLANCQDELVTKIQNS